MAAEFVDAYSKNTGRKHRVPDYFVGHEVLGRDLQKTPPKSERTAPKASKKASPSGKAATTRTTETPAAGENQE